MNPFVGNTMRIAAPFVTGGGSSLTVTVKKQVLVLPETSKAVHTTVFVPTGNAEPDSGETFVLVSAQLSLTVGGGNVTTALAWPNGMLVAMSAGHVIEGSSVSFTITSNEQLSLPLVLVAMHETVVAPTSKKYGEVMAFVPIRNVTVGSGTPFVVTANAMLRPHWPGALLVVMLEGHVIVGAMAGSNHILVAVHVEENPYTVTMA